MRATGLSLGVAAVVVGIGSAGVTADAAILQKVAETGSAYSHLGVPSLNDQGVMVFQAVNAVAARGVYYGTPGAVQQVATPGLAVAVGQGNVERVGINSAGQIAFTAVPPNPNNFTGIDGVYRYNPAGGGTVSTIVQPWSDASTSYVSDGPAINDNGLVAVLTWGQGRKLMTGDGSAAATNQTIGASGSSFLDLHLNDQGHSLRVAFGTTSQGTLVLDGRNIVSPTSPKYTDPSGVFTGTFDTRRADLADNDRVVFSGDFYGGVTRALYLWQNDTITMVPGSYWTSSQAPVPAINDLGTVVALMHGTQDYLSVFKDGQSATVISVGDAFDGSTVSGLDFIAEGLNDQDQVAFTVALADGRSVNVLTSVPEPGNMGVVLAVGIGALLRRRR